MNKEKQITCLFLDIGGVLLSDGWDGNARKRAAKEFDFDFREMNDRHQIVFATYEEGKLTKEEYLDRTVFFKPRTFTRDQFWNFMTTQSSANAQMMELARGLKARYGLKIVVVSNEALELNAYRIRKFKLTDFVDAFVSSCFVHLRKPDPDIFRLAIDIAQVPPHEIIYIENTTMFAQIAESFGIHSIVHSDYHLTEGKLAEFGLQFFSGGSTESD